MLTWQSYSNMGAMSHSIIGVLEAGAQGERGALASHGSWIECIAQAIPEKVEGEQRDRKDDCG